VGLHGRFGHVSPSGLAHPGPSSLPFSIFFFTAHLEFSLGLAHASNPCGPEIFPPISISLEILLKYDQKPENLKRE
jgi:hypothetical protein